MSAAEGCLEVLGLDRLEEWRDRAASGPASGTASGPASGAASGPASGPASGAASGPASGPASGAASGTASGPASGTASGPAAPDIAYCPEYAALFEANGDGQSRLLHFQSALGRVVYPVLLRPVVMDGVATGYCDLTSPYGYSGPFLVPSAGQGGALLARAFRSAVHRYCLENRIVTEFTRFHPLLETDRQFADQPGFEVVCPTVVVDLTRPPEEIWTDSFDGRTRNAIRRAQRLGVQVEMGTGEVFLASFVRHYRQTMRRVRASTYYFFRDEFFAQLGRSIGPLGIFMQARYNGSVIASIVLLKGPRFLHYFLSGSDPEYRQVPAVNLLLFHAVQWGLARGLERFHLGGGYAGANDSLFRFKAGFSPRRGRYCVAKVIHQPAVYAHLVAARFGARPAAGLFPLYRAEGGGEAASDG